MTTTKSYKLRWGSELTNWPLIKLRMAAAQFNELGCDVDIWNLEHPIVGVAQLSDDRRVVELKITEYPSPPVARWSALFGNAISSLRSAADSFAWELAHLEGREPPNARQVYFPTAEKRKDWHRQVQNLGALPEALVERFADLRELDEGGWTSWMVALAKLNNIDKHQSSLKISPDFSNASTDDLTISFPQNHGGTSVQFIPLLNLRDARCGDVVARIYFSAPVLDAQGSLWGNVAPAVEFGPLQYVSETLHQVVAYALEYLRTGDSCNDEVDLDESGGEDVETDHAVR